jgi:hypothetical protein
MLTRLLGMLAPASSGIIATEVSKSPSMRRPHARSGRVRSLLRGSDIDLNDGAETELELRR